MSPLYTLNSIKFNCRVQFMVMSFAHFTDRSGLRDIETTLDFVETSIDQVSR